MLILLSLIVYSLPFWSLPFIPGTYSAITPYISALLGIFYFFYCIVIDGRVNKASILLSFFFLTLILIYSVFSLSYYDNAIVNSVFYIVGFFSFLGFSFLFRFYTFEQVLNRLYHVSLFVSFYAIFDLLSSKIDSLLGIRNLLSMFLVGKESPRLLITTSEPSWAVQLLLFCSVPLIFKYQRTKSKLCLLLVFTNILAFLSAFSMTGFIVLLVSMLLHLLLFSKVKISSVMKSMVVFFFLVLGIYTTYNIFSGDGGYIFSRISRLIDILMNGSSSIYYAIISIDNSLLIRLGYPTVAFNMVLDHPLGLGVGAFSNNLQYYTYLLDVPSFSTSEVPNHLANNNADPRNYFLRIAVDFGVFGILFMLYYAKASISRLKRNGDLLTKSYFCITFAMMLQFSTFYFSIYMFVFAMIWSSKYD